MFLLDEIVVQKFKDVPQNKFFVTWTNDIAQTCLKGIDNDDGFNEQVAFAVEPGLPDHLGQPTFIRVDAGEPVATLMTTSLSPDMKSAFAVPDVQLAPSGTILMMADGNILLRCTGERDFLQYFNLKTGAITRKHPGGRYIAVKKWSLVLRDVSGERTVFTIPPLK